MIFARWIVTWDKVLKLLNGYKEGCASAGKSIYGVPNLYVTLSSSDVRDILVSQRWADHFSVETETDNTCWVYRRHEDASHGKVAR